MLKVLRISGKKIWNLIKYYGFKKDEKEEILRRLKEFFEREERIKLVYIFGGFTRRNVVRDIDVAV